MVRMLPPNTTRGSCHPTCSLEAGGSSLNNLKSSNMNSESTEFSESDLELKRTHEIVTQYIHRYYGVGKFGS